MESLGLAHIAWHPFRFRISYSKAQGVGSCPSCVAQASQCHKMLHVNKGMGDPHGCMSHFEAPKSVVSFQHLVALVSSDDYLSTWVVFSKVENQISAKVWQKISCIITLMCCTFWTTGTVGSNVHKKRSLGKLLDIYRSDSLCVQLLSTVIASICSRKPHD